MKAKEIKFAPRECVINVKYLNDNAPLKVGNAYNYEIVGNQLVVNVYKEDNGKNNKLSIPVELMDRTGEDIKQLSTFKGRSLLRLENRKEKNKEQVYVFTLLGFNKKIENIKYEIILDDAIRSDLRKRKLTSPTAIKYFREEFVLEGKYWFVYGGSVDNKKQRIYGKHINIGIEESSQGYLHVTDIRENRNTVENLITLMCGSIKFKIDTEESKRLTENFRKQYAAAVASNDELIALWKLYDDLDLEVTKKNAEEMGTIKYKSFTRAPGRIIFNLDRGVVHKDFLKENMGYVAVSKENFNVENPLDYNNSSYINLGSDYDNSCVNTKCFIITDEDYDFGSTIPDTGYIVPSISGSIVQKKRREMAEGRILSGKNPLIGLNMLIQSGVITGEAAKERAPISDQLRKHCFGNNKKLNFNAMQKEAIRIAINTPDIAIIQGPPGTGKTQVIKAIVERINELENGEARILITSTQHDAVDNAVKGVTYGGVPVNRVTNKKRKNTEEPIYGWIDEMILHSKEWLEKNKLTDKYKEIFLCLKELALHDDSEKECLEKLYSLSLNDVDLLKIVDRIKEVLVNSCSVNNSYNMENERIAKLIGAQRFTKQEFLEDGTDTLKSLERYLKFDYEGDFKIPTYWKKLERISTDTEELDTLLPHLKEDIENLKAECNLVTDNNVCNESRESLINSIINDLQMKIGSKDEDREEKLYNLIWTFSHELGNIQNIRNLIASYSQVNAATCQQAANKNINPGMQGFDEVYDYVIIDEAARSNPLDLLIPMSMGKKIILVGDHKQLPHMLEKEVVEAVVEKQDDEKIIDILKESLFLRLYKSVAAADKAANKDGSNSNKIVRTCMLNEQFRMHPDICDLVNVFYEKDENGNKTTGLKTGCLREDKLHNLNLYKNKALAWIDVPISADHPIESGGKSKFRKCEIEIIKNEINKILSKNTKFDIGIISFYKKQVNLILDMIQKEFPSELHRISVGTVDAFQGKEFDIVILSTVRANNSKNIRDRVGFLDNDNRLCVAFSRAKRLLITVGDSHTVANDGNNVIIEALNELFKRSRNGDVGYYERIR